MAEFNFSAKPTVRISGKDYEFDPSNNSLLEGVVRDFPHIVSLSHDFEDMQRQMTDKNTIPPDLLAKNEELLLTCKSFIVGCLGNDEYNEIFSVRRPNTGEHVKLCAFLYEQMMTGREEVLNSYLGDSNDLASNA